MTPPLDDRITSDSNFSCGFSKSPNLLAVNTVSFAIKKTGNEILSSKEVRGKRPSLNHWYLYGMTVASPEVISQVWGLFPQGDAVFISLVLEV